MSTTTRTPATTCPHCRAELTAATSLDGDGGPGPGDLSLCVGCSALLVFTHDMSLRLATGEDLHGAPLAYLLALLAAQCAIVARQRSKSDDATHH